MNQFSPSLVVSCLDATAINGTESLTEVLELMDSAREGAFGVSAAAIVTRGEWLEHLVPAAFHSGVATAVVSGLYPTGTGSLEVAVNEIDNMCAAGAQEIDIVLDYAALLNGDRTTAARSVEEQIAAAGSSKVKVIIESGQLRSEENISKATQVAVEAGASYVSTSTGVCPVGATDDAVAIIASTLTWMGADRVGVKVCGGVRTLQDATRFARIVARRRPEVEFTPDTFRVGSSTLLARLQGVETP